MPVLPLLVFVLAPRLIVLAIALASLGSFLLAKYPLLFYHRSLFFLRCCHPGAESWRFQRALGIQTTAHHDFQAVEVGLPRIPVDGGLEPEKLANRTLRTHKLSRV